MGALKFTVLEPRIVFDASLTGGLGGDPSFAKPEDTSHEEAYEMMKRSIQNLEQKEAQLRLSENYSP